MSLRDIGRDAVVQATAEYDRLGQDEFLRTYGYGRAREYELLLDGRTYDSKAVLGVAHKYAMGVPLTRHQLSGGEQTVSRLVDLGFEILRSDTVRSPGIGEVAGVPSGRVFPSRSALAAAGVHRAHQAGIVGTAPRGAESIVVSGGYEDDEDYGQAIVYTGHGGRDRAGRQVADQTFGSTGNAALVTSCLTGSPVRLCRGPVADSPHAPAEGYRYDGLYTVESYWREPGRRGYLVCRFRLLQLTPAGLGGAVDVGAAAQPPAGGQTPGRQPTTVQRIVRSTAVADYVKRLHDHTCQVCGTRLNVGDRGYSEGAHIRPLGRPHDGPDVPTNMLCLCANCHVLFDNGAITIQGQRVLVDGQPHGSLRTHRDHLIDDSHTAYHRAIHR
jgi:putative restriction endonuclease